jgi:radical SAM protein with 4Fe4S-binding SPASM domain
MNIKHKIKNNLLPLTVSIEPNNICNAKCTFCGYGKEKTEITELKLNDRPVLDKRKKDQVSDEVVDHLFKLCEKDGAGILKKLSISPNFGEVSINRKWIDMIVKAKSINGINNISSFTNAINLHTIGIDRIVDSGISNIEISTSLVDRESYKRLYGRDKYDQVLKNILDLLSANKSKGSPIDIYINLRIDLPQENFEKSEAYKKIIKYIDKRKISYLTKYDTWGGVIKKDSIPKGATFISVKNNKGKPPCLQLYKTLYVKMDGTIQACKCVTHESLNTRNILDYSSIQSAWRNDKYDQIRKNWEEHDVLPEACITCTHYMKYTNLISYYSKKKAFRTYLRSVLSGTIYFKWYKKISNHKGSMRESMRNEEE